MRRRIKPVFVLAFFSLFALIIILGNIQAENARQKELRAAQAAIPATEQNSEKAKTKNSDGDTFTLNPIVDISGWQLPSEIDYDTLSKNISGAIVRVQGGSGIAKKIMQLTVPELINRLRPILKSSKNAAYLWPSMLMSVDPASKK